ncbi:MAG: hypothetical protein LUC88_01645 [Prevotella sp.]|nr:hypothetical protein [Prevotella sp.]
MFVRLGHLFRYPSTIVVALLLAMTVISCGDDEDHIVPLQMNYSAGYISSCFNGYGWKYVESHEVNPDGSFEKQNWDEVYGGTPDQYLFEGDTIVVFSSLDDYPLKGYTKSVYSYNEDTNQLMSGSDELFRVLTMSENTLRLIKYNGFSSDGKKTYLYAVYRRMSSEELARYRNEYKYDIAKLNDNYPLLPEKTRITADSFTDLVSGTTWEYVEAHEVMWSKRYKKERFSSPEINRYNILHVSADSLSFSQLSDSLNRCLVSETMKYGYRPNSSAVVSDGNVVFYVYSISENSLQIVMDLLEPRSNYSKKTLFCKYRKKLE